MTTTEADRVEQAKVAHRASELDEAFTKSEWLDIIWAARERGISVHALVHDAVMEDLYR